MKDTSNDNMTNADRGHYERQRCEKFVDIHCHCLAGFDDGPSAISESVDLCKALADENISIVAATPHQLGRFEGLNEAQNVRDAVIELNQILKNQKVPVKVVPGGEVRVDERICRLLEVDKVLTVADSGRYILLELPHQVFIDIEPMLKELASMGVRPIISHAERITALAKEPNILSRWFEHSTSLQITASSLLGGFGVEAEKMAWNLLASGWAGLVATDSHDINSRRPEMRAAYELITTKFGKDLADQVCIYNPLRVIKAMNMLPCPIFEKQEVSL
jgi:protein-tyrosine phosphatase